MKELYRRNAGILKQQTDCQIRLRVDETDRQTKMYFRLSGTKLQVEAALEALEHCLVAADDFYTKDRTLYYLALLNNHRRKSENVVHQFCCNGAKRWMQCKNLPNDFRNIIGILIGKNGSNKKRIMKETGCNVEINTNCTYPHVSISGNAADDVRKCVLEIEERLKSARKVKEQERRAK